MDYNDDQTLDQYCPIDITDTLMLSGSLKTITLSIICVEGLAKPQSISNILNYTLGFFCRLHT
jgi:hypothetical protein